MEDYPRVSLEEIRKKYPLPEIPKKQLTREQILQRSRCWGCEHNFTRTDTFVASSEWTREKMEYHLNKHVA
jgi:hypothetical protein